MFKGRDEYMYRPLWDVSHDHSSHMKVGMGTGRTTDRATADGMHGRARGWESLEEQGFTELNSIHTHAYTLTHAYSLTHAYTHTLTHAYALTHTYAPTHAYALIHKYMHTDAFAQKPLKVITLGIIYTYIQVFLNNGLPFIL